MSNRGLLTVTATDTPAVITALRAALAGEAAVAILPTTNSARSQAVRQAIDPATPVAESIAIVATTSGSTGNPKGVLLSHVAITASISAVDLELGFTPQWHLVLPIQHVAGTMTALRGLTPNSKLHQPTINAADPMQLAAYAKSVKDLAGLHAIALVPEHLNRLEIIEELDSLRYFHKVIVGAGSMRTELRAKLSELAIPIVSSYGLTETCGGIVWDGMPLSSVAISLNEIGEVLIESAMNASGYRDSTEDLTVINTHDLGDLSSGKLKIIGRSDNKVKIKGHLLDLTVTSNLVKELTGYTAVALVDDELLHLIIESVPFDYTSLQQNLLDQLGDALKGCRISFREKIPRTDLGKIDMFTLRAELLNG
jgi:o-succinylbenzoate---CoA ligase